MTRFHNICICLILASLITGCSVSTEGWTAGPISYGNPGGGSGYGGVPSGAPYGSLNCEITYPPAYTRIDSYSETWIYGVIWREGMDIDTEIWDGPLWEVNGYNISESYYWFEQFNPEVWVRFPFDPIEIGPGVHQVKITVWDGRNGGYIPVTDLVNLIVQ